MTKEQAIAITTMNLKSIREIADHLREQANLRAPENDEAGVLLGHAIDLERDVDNLERPTKRAWMWAFAIEPGTVGYPGISADLYFSSPRKFYEALGRDPIDGEWLLPVTVPADFDNWDYIPSDY